MKRIETAFADAELRLNDVTEKTKDAARDITASRAANASLAQASDAFQDGSARISGALSRIAEDGTVLRTAEARLLFENARLKRSGKGLTESIALLDKARKGLIRRAREARTVAEIAGRTATLIDEINACVVRGEPVTHLLEAGWEILENAPPASHRITR